MHSLPWTMAALLVCYSPQITTKPIWISGLIFACALIRWLAISAQRPPLAVWIRTPLGIAAFLAVLYSFGGINGVEPGSALLSVMAAMKLLETKNQRDQFVLLFICLFLMLATFLQEQTLWSVPYLLVAFFVTLSAWMAVSRRGDPPARHWYTRQAGLAFSLSLPLLAVMWVLFPRVPGPFWAIPTQSGAANTGLSSSMSPGDISALSQSSAVAFRVKFEQASPGQEKLYWRAIVMQKFDGRTWSADEPTYTSNANARIESIGDAQVIDYSITLEPTRQRWLFGLDLPTSWRGEGIYMSRFMTLERTRPIDERLSYNVSSNINATAALDLSDRAKRWYTNLPENGNPDARVFATELRNASTSDEALVERLLQFYRSQPFFYTLSPPALGRDSVDEFLFGTRRGFCEHYASSFTFLMRAAGIPARVVAGYQGGEQNPLGNYWIVRQSDAHAWAEVWLAGRGWVRVDPTAAVAPQRIEQNLESALRELGEFSPGAFELPVLERLQLIWDVVNARWNEWVLGFGPETQINFFEWLGLDDPDWRDLVIILAILLIAIMAMVSAWLAWQHRPPALDAAQKQYQRLQKRLKMRPQQGETATQFAERVVAAYPDQKIPVETVIWNYLRARYADDGKAGRKLTKLVTAVKPQRRPARLL